jgi:arylsulfatase A-like enzyme
MLLLCNNIELPLPLSPMDWRWVGLAHAALEAYDPAAADAKPLFFYLPWQNVHAPYEAPLGWSGDVLQGMLSATDAALGAIVQTLKRKKMWASVLVLSLFAAVSFVAHFSRMTGKSH